MEKVGTMQVRVGSLTLEAYANEDGQNQAEKIAQYNLEWTEWRGVPVQLWIRTAVPGLDCGPTGVTEQRVMTLSHMPFFPSSLLSGPIGMKHVEGSHLDRIWTLQKQGDTF